MEQKETLLDNLFQEFQSSFNKATQEEKKRLVAHFYVWAEQQADSLGILPPHNVTGSIKKDQEQPLETTYGVFQSKNIQDITLQDIQDLVNNETHLSQIADNIEQVLWLREFRSGRILYVSPAFDVVWGRSSESLYADPGILIESVHLEDRVQFMVASSHSDSKPFNQVYRILRPDGSLRWIFAHTFLISEHTGEAYFQICIAQDVTDQKQIELALRKTLDRIREQFNLSRKMSLARKPEAVLKTLMSAHELRSAQRAALLFFDNPKVGPAGGVELSVDWLSSQNLSPWLSESSLYEEPSIWDMLPYGI